MHTLTIALAIASIVLGVCLVLRALWPRPRVLAGEQVIVAARVRPRLRVSARQLGLASRGLARLLRSPRRPRDSEFHVFERYLEDVDSGAIALAAPYAFWTVARASEPLLELEQLLESLERFTARVRRWRPGRRHERN